MPAPLYPRVLQPGDRIALISPSSPLGDQAALERGLLRLRAWELVPELMPHAMRRLDHPRGGELAGTDDERAADLQQAISDPRFRGVFCVRGGHAARGRCMRFHGKSVLITPAT